MEERSVRVGMIFSSILRIKIIFFLFIRFKLFMFPLLIMICFLFHIPEEEEFFIYERSDTGMVEKWRKKEMNQWPCCAWICWRCKHLWELEFELPLLSW